ncbi:MAG: heavy metal-binding domain-containing protein [Saprospiraceae bacterium]|nr:heavy metal-binding domain-containing protein [Saprospiraceae bacterium]
MKNVFQSFGVTLLIIVSLFLVSCGELTPLKNTSTSSEPHGTTAEFTSAYVCPMHCKDSGSDAAGTCPVCGMDYVKSEEHTKDGHKH